MPKTNTSTLTERRATTARHDTLTVSHAMWAYLDRLSDLSGGAPREAVSGGVRLHRLGGHLQPGEASSFGRVQPWPAGGPKCYDAETEVLTREGWQGFPEYVRRYREFREKNISAVKERDKLVRMGRAIGKSMLLKAHFENLARATLSLEIATYNPETHEMEFQLPSDTADARYQGTMVTATSRGAGINLRTNAGHEHYARITPKRGGRPAGAKGASGRSYACGEFQKIFAGDLAGFAGSGDYDIDISPLGLLKGDGGPIDGNVPPAWPDESDYPHWGKANGSAGLVHLVDLAALLFGEAVLFMGNSSESSEGDRVEFAVPSGLVADSIHDALRGMGMMASHNHFRVEKTPFGGLRFTIGDKDIFGWLYDNFVDRDSVPDGFCGPVALTRISERIMAWPAYWRLRLLTSMAGKGADASRLQRLAMWLDSGYPKAAIAAGCLGASLGFRVAHYGGGGVNFYAGKARVNIEVAEASERVYCATVPNGLLYVRRRGCVAISGNSGTQGGGVAPVSGNCRESELELRFQQKRGAGASEDYFVAMADGMRDGSPLLSTSVQAGHFYERRLFVYGVDDFGNDVPRHRLLRHMGAVGLRNSPDFWDPCRPWRGYRGGLPTFSLALRGATEFGPSWHDALKALGGELPEGYQWHRMPGCDYGELYVDLGELPADEKYAQREVGGGGPAQVCSACGDALRGHEDESGTHCRWCVTGWAPCGESDREQDAVDHAPAEQ